MNQAFNSLEATTIKPIGDIGQFFRLNHIQGKLKYEPGERSLAFHDGTCDEPLVTMNCTGITAGKTRLEIGKGKYGSDRNPHIHYSLTHLLGGDFPGKIKLNHLGICINVEDSNAQIHEIVEGYRDSIHQVFEDPAGREESMRWLFIGNIDGGPMFEVVLPKKKLLMKNHFQIDVDTTATQNEIDEYMRVKFGKRNFFDWGLIIPNVGKVLQMGILQTCDTYDIRLGVGNNARNRMIHRKSLEKLS